MRPIPLIFACLTPVVIGGVVYLAYQETPRQVLKTQANLASYSVMEPPRAITPSASGSASMMAEAPPIAPPDAAEATAPLKVSVPKIAYTYRYAFTLPAAAIVKTAEAHVALCDRLGPARCQLLAMSNGTGDDQRANAHLKLRVASAIARRFGNQLERSVGTFGGRASSRSIDAEDVSKDVSDTEARLRQRELLVARLTEVLRTRRGSVAELVEAERSVAGAQEEIDQAKGWLSELQGRLAMSTVDIDYAATLVTLAPPSSDDGLDSTIVSSVKAFATGMTGVLTAIVFALPWAGLLLLCWFGWRRLRPHWRRATDYGTELDDGVPS